MSKEQHLTPAETAEHYGVSLRTVRRWIAAGKVEVIRPTPGRAMYVRIRDNAA